MRFSRQRSYEKELLDAKDSPFSDIRQNMRELDFINTWLGGHNISVDGIRKIYGRSVPGGELHIAEIGCGGGDNLRAVARWAKKKNIEVRLTGIDINPACIEYARSVEANKGMNFICSDYRDVSFDTKPHIVFSSLFCHHFTENDLVFMLRWMHGNSTAGFFINDLHRHVLAYYSIALLTRAFSKSYLVKNDAPLSVNRGFVRTEWEQIFSAAGLSSCRCKWKWAFRWLVTCTHS
jgi:2-polyprenyl-3-methyl-5-hydroxy-6-metoxy-1,4-benzoquinol methylase